MVKASLTAAGMVVHEGDTRAGADVAVVIGAAHHETSLPSVLIVEPEQLPTALKRRAAGVLTTKELGLIPETVALVAQGLRVSHGPRALLELLGAEQFELLRLLCTGLGDGEIGRAVGFSRRQVQRRVYELFRILGVRSRGEALLIAGGLGLSPHHHVLP